MIELILRHRFLFVKSARLQLNRERAGEFYREHQGLFSLGSISLSAMMDFREIFLRSSHALYEWVC